MNLGLHQESVEITPLHAHPHALHHPKAQRTAAGSVQSLAPNLHRAARAKRQSATPLHQRRRERETTTATHAPVRARGHRQGNLRRRTKVAKALRQRRSVGPAQWIRVRDPHRRRRRRRRHSKRTTKRRRLQKLRLKMISAISTPVVEA